MPTTVFLIIAIIIMALLFVVFVLTFILFIKMPAPKGCENMKVNNENCAGCSHKECSFYPGEKE